jgi:hypothetical protein
VPDGLFHLTAKKAKYVVAVEVELSTKSENRYRKLFRELLLQPDFNVVLYLVKGEEMKKYLRRLFAEVLTDDLVVQTASRRNAIYFAKLPEFLEKGLGATFQGEGSTFSFESLVKS